MSDYHMGHNPPQDGCGRPTVECDDEDCVALEDPETIEDFRLALEHWKNHSLSAGCSHGC